MIGINSQLSLRIRYERAALGFEFHALTLNPYHLFDKRNYHMIMKSWRKITCAYDLLQSVLSPSSYSPHFSGTGGASERLKEYAHLMPFCLRPVGDYQSLPLWQHLCSPPLQPGSGQTQLNTSPADLLVNTSLLSTLLQQLYLCWSYTISIISISLLAVLSSVICWVASCDVYHFHIPLEPHLMQKCSRYAMNKKGSCW